MKILEWQKCGCNVGEPGQKPTDSQQPHQEDT